MELALNPLLLRSGYDTGYISGVKEVRSCPARFRSGEGVLWSADS